MNHLIKIIVLILGIAGAIFAIHNYSVQNRPVGKIIMEGDSGALLEVKKSDIISKFDPNSTLNNPKVTNELCLSVASLAYFTALAGGAFFTFCIVKLLIALAEIFGKFHLMLRRFFLLFSNSWIKNYGICRFGSRELLNNYYELLKIVSNGISTAYEKPTIFLTFNGTVTDLITRYKESDMLKDIFDHWRELNEQHSIDVKRVFAPPPYKWRLIDDELETISLTIYKIITGSIETYWTHSQDEWSWDQIRKAEKLSPGLDFALFAGEDPVKNEFSPKACVGYVKNSLVYKLQTTDIKEQSNYYQEIGHYKRRHQEIINAVIETSKGDCIANFFKFKNNLPLIKGRRQRKNAKLKEKLEELLNEELRKEKAREEDRA